MPRIPSEKKREYNRKYRNKLKAETDSPSLVVQELNDDSEPPKLITKDLSLEFSPTTFSLSSGGKERLKTFMEDDSIDSKSVDSCRGGAVPDITIEKIAPKVEFNDCDEVDEPETFTIDKETMMELLQCYKAVHGAKQDPKEAVRESETAPSTGAFFLRTMKNSIVQTVASTLPLMAISILAKQVGPMSQTLLKNRLNIEPSNTSPSSLGVMPSMRTVNVA